MIGIDVSDSLVIVSVRGPASGVVHPDWRVSAVNETKVRNKKQLAAALHAVAVGTNARFVLHKVNGVGSDSSSGNSSGKSCLILHRHVRRGYGLNLDDDLFVRSLRVDTDAYGKVKTGWRLQAVDGTPVTSKRQLVSALCSSSESSACVPNALSAEFLFRHAAPATTSSAPTFEQEIGVPRAGQSTFISEAVSPDAVFDIAQIGPSPAPSPMPIQTSTTTPATTMHLVDEAEPSGMTMPAIGTRARMSSCSTASGPLMFDV